MTADKECRLREEYKELGLTPQAVERYVHEHKEREIIADYE